MSFYTYSKTENLIDIKKIERKWERHDSTMLPRSLSSLILYYFAERAKFSEYWLVLMDGFFFFL